MSFMAVISSCCAKYTSSSLLILGVNLGGGEFNFESKYLCKMFWLLWRRDKCWWFGYDVFFFFIFFIPPWHCLSCFAHFSHRGTDGTVGGGIQYVSSFSFLFQLFSGTFSSKAEMGGFWKSSTSCLPYMGWRFPLIEVSWAASFAFSFTPTFMFQLLVFWLSIAGDGVRFVVLLRVIALLDMFIFLGFTIFFLLCVGMRVTWFLLSFLRILCLMGW